MLRQAIVNGPEDRRREAETQLMAIRDVDAIKPLLRVLGGDEDRRNESSWLRSWPQEIPGKRGGRRGWSGFDLGRGPRQRSPAGDLREAQGS